MIRKTIERVGGVVLLLVLLCGCKGEKKMVQYGEVYRDRPTTLYIAPLYDHALRRAVRLVEDSAYNASIGIAARQLYLTAAAPLVRNGYYVPGPLTSAQLAATESRTLKQLRYENISDYYTQLGIDAILFINVEDWDNTHNTWTVEVDYTLRSTQHGGELMHTRVRATKMVHTDFRGRPRPLKEDLDFAKQYNCDVATAQRCRLVEIVNQYILGDLPSGSRSRGNVLKRYVSTHPEYFALHITPDGSVMVLSNDEEI